MLERMEDEFTYYKAHQEELFANYGEKVIILSNHEVIGSFDSELEALEAATSKGLKAGTFIIQRCGLGIENYARTINTRILVTNDSNR